MSKGSLDIFKLHINQEKIANEEQSDNHWIYKNFRF